MQVQHAHEHEGWRIDQILRKESIDTLTDRKRDDRIGMRAGLLVRLRHRGERTKNPSFVLLEKTFSVAEWVRVRKCLSIKYKAVCDKLNRDIISFCYLLLVALSKSLDENGLGVWMLWILVCEKLVLSRSGLGLRQRGCVTDSSFLKPDIFSRLHIFLSKTATNDQVLMLKVEKTLCLKTYGRIPFSHFHLYGAIDNWTPQHE